MFFVNKNLTLEETHQIDHYVHDNVEKNIINVKHCMERVNPK